MQIRLPPLLLVGLTCLIGCGSGDATTPQGSEAPPPTPQIGPGPHDQAVLEMGELGVIRIELLPELAPTTVAHFTRLAKEGFYDGTYFHRVIPGFMIQGGDPNTKDNDPRNDGKGGSSRIDDEFTGFPQVRGTVSMANNGFRNSSASQFFIVHEDSRDLDGAYSAFGRVVSGMEVVDAVTRLELDLYGRYGPKNRPYPVSAGVETLRIEPAAETPTASVAAAGTAP